LNEIASKTGHYIIEIAGALKKPGGRKKQVQARGKAPRSQSLFFTSFAPLVQLMQFFNSPIVAKFRAGARY